MASVHSGHEHPAVHGMLVVGEGQLFLSHLPMFHAPHDYQIIMEVRLRGDESDPHTIYTRDRGNSGERLYTWIPKPFILPGLLSSPPQRFNHARRCVPRSFRAGRDTDHGGHGAG
jgi:hypothetical protein